jgi:hypothetical protein
MKKKIFGILAATAIAFTFVFGSALTVHAADIPFLQGSLSEAIMTAALTDVNTRKPNFIEYDYLIYQDSSTTFLVALFDRYFDNYIRFDMSLDSDWDLDRVGIVFSANATYPRVSYKYDLSNGSYVSTYNSTSGTDYTFPQDKYMYYTNMDIYERTFDPEYFPSVVINVKQSTGYKNLYPVDPNWLLNAGVDPDYLWWQIDQDIQYELLEEEKKQTDFWEKSFCIWTFGLIGDQCDVVIDEIKTDLGETQNPLTFWIELIGGVSTLVVGLIEWGAEIVVTGIAAVSGVFNAVIGFGTSMKSLFGYLPDPVDNVANLGVDISIGVGLLKLGRLLFLKV